MTIEGKHRVEARQSWGHKWRHIPAAICVVLIAAGTAYAAQPATPTAFKGFGNNKDPIQIEADTMNVATPDQIVTFSGNVNVHQKDATLVSQVLKVFYDNGPQGQSPAQGQTSGQGGAPAQSPLPAKTQPQIASPPQPTAAAPASDAPNAQLRRFEASGGLKISEPDQSVTGDSGWFDIAAQKAEVDGNVVLIQAKNTARGCKFLINLKTGVYNLEPCPGKRIQLLIDPGAKDGASAQAKPK